MKLEMDKNVNRNPTKWKSDSREEGYGEDKFPCCRPSLEHPATCSGQVGMSKEREEVCESVLTPLVEKHEKQEQEYGQGRNGRNGKHNKNNIVKIPSKND